MASRPFAAGSADINLHVEELTVVFVVFKVWVFLVEDLSVWSLLGFMVFQVYWGSAPAWRLKSQTPDLQTV